MQRTNCTSACASCKHQRKKCTEKCALAPFFPAGRTREFQAVHKVFGVSNVTKIIATVREEDRKVAVDSLVWEALCRLRDPVLGPFGDYRRVCEELRMFKSQYQHSNQVFVGCNNNYNKVVNKNGENFHADGNYMVDFCSYGFSPNHLDSGKERDERENGHAIKPIVIPQPHLPNGFNQQYILEGQYNPLWEGCS